MTWIRFAMCYFGLCGGTIYVNYDAYWRCTKCGKVHK